MRILQNYIFREILFPFILSLAVLNFIFMAGYLVKAADFIFGRGVSVLNALYILMLALPGMIGYTVPTSLLMAILIVFGNLSQNNELRAMKASGVYLLHVLIPAFIIGFILSFGMFIFNDQIAGNTSFQLRKELKKMVIRFPKALVEPGRFVKVSDSVIFMAKSMQGDILHDIIAYEVEASDNPVRTIIAERGEILSDEEKGKLQIRLYNGSISDSQDQSVNTIHFKTYEFPTLGQEDISKMQKKKKDYSLAEIIVEMGVPSDNPEDELELRTAFHERISFSLGSFIFVLIGVPIAMLVRRGEVVLSFGIAMAAASSYYIFFAGAKTLALQDLLSPPLALWLPNIVLVVFGIFLLRKSLAA